MILIYYLELLNKDKDQRINIKVSLDHPWFAGSNTTISQMRKQASGDQMMQFISYSNVDPKAAELAHKKSQGSNSPKSSGNFGGFQIGSLIEPGKNMIKLNHGPGSGNLPNLDQLGKLLDKKEEDANMSDNWQ